jgi:lambda repressor-like predicted transcriptional regulator
MSDNLDMSKRLKELVTEGLRRKGWSQNYFAEHVLGINKASVSQWWRSGYVSRRNIKVIHEELEIPYEDIYAALEADGASITDDDKQADINAKAIAAAVRRLPAESQDIVIALVQTLLKSDEGLKTLLPKPTRPDTSNTPTDVVAERGIDGRGTPDTSRKNSTGHRPGVRRVSDKG